MGTLTISLDDEVERKLRKVAKMVIGEKKGYLGKAITEALKLWMEKIRKESIEERVLEELERGFEMGKILIKKREEIYE
jgi:predicted transcriptional regulator